MQRRNADFGGAPSRESWLEIAGRDPPPMPIGRDPVRIDKPRARSSSPVTRDIDNAIKADTLKMKTRDDSALPQWDHLKREPWMRIAKRDPPPGFDSNDFNNPGARTKMTQPGAEPRRPVSTADAPYKKETANEPWLRHKFKKRGPLERESWMAIAKKDPPPMVYTAPKPKAPKKPSIAVDMEAAKANAMKKIDKQMKQEKAGQVVVVSAPPSLPNFLRREKWSAIAQRDPPPRVR